MTRFPNLYWAIENRRARLRDFEPVLHCSASQVSRKLNGLAPLAPHERTRISEILGFDEAWLFAEPRPVPIRAGFKFTPAYETRAAAAQ